MKKILKFFGFVGITYLLLIGWLFLMREFNQTSYEFQKWFMLLLVAPLAEELGFRYVPLQIGKILALHTKHTELLDITGLLANVVFIWWHLGHWRGSFSIQWAILVQGVIGWACWIVCKRYGYLPAVILHSKINFFILIFML